MSTTLPVPKLDKLNAFQKYQGLTKQSATPYHMTTNAALSRSLGYNPLDFEGNAMRTQISNDFSDNTFMRVSQEPKNSAAGYVANNKSTTPQDVGLGSVQDKTDTPTQIDKPPLRATPPQSSGGILPISDRPHDRSTNTSNMLKYGTAEDQDAYFKGLDIEDKDKPTDWGMEGYGGVALGAGQLGLGVMSYLENSKTADKQRALMDQQITNNKFALGSAKDFSAALTQNFNKGS